MDNLALLQEVSKRDGVDGRIATALEEAVRLVNGGAQALEESLDQACTGVDEGIVAPCKHIIEAGGKRIRPLLCLLSHRANNGSDSLPIEAATACELLHNATLLHDDVIDEGEIRRGRTASRVVHGNAISVLGGDYLLIKTVEMVSRMGQPFMDLLIETMHRLIDGELVQLEQRGSIDTSEQEYLRVIEGKTASLFRWAARSGAMAAGATDKTSERMGRFGWHVGMAFQLMDDLLDFEADATVFGKSLLSDIGEGKMTLPVILAAKQSDELTALLENLTTQADFQNTAKQIAALIQSSQVMDQVRQKAAKHTQTALENLDSISGLNMEFAELLREISQALLNRRF